MKQTLPIVTFLILIFSAIPSLEAQLVINRFFVAEGQASPLPGNFGGSGGAAPDAIAGNGNLIDIFNAAADAWEEVIDADRSVDMYFTWQNRTGGVLGSALSATQSTDPAPFLAYIRFDNNEIGGTTRSWFMDEDPLDNSEFSNRVDSTQDLGGGEMNVGRVLSGATGDAAGNFDLYTVALHEIGHALGWNESAANWATTLTLRPDLAYDGAQIQTIPGGHTHPSDHPQTLLAPNASFGQRKLISDVDALGLAQLTGDNTFIVEAIPEPSSGVLIAFLTTVFATTRREPRIV